MLQVTKGAVKAVGGGKTRPLVWGKGNCRTEVWGEMEGESERGKKRCSGVHRNSCMFGGGGGQTLTL